VDDAFQATFLVLVRKAGSIARGERLGPWLYGVAYRVTRRVREKAARAPTCEPEAAAMIPDRPRHLDPTDDWLPVLDRELQALPPKYREPLVLCELQGLTRKAAAERLRVREGTLSSRLARGRALLRKRLLKHGTLLPAGGLAALLGSEGVVKGVPAELLGRTAETVAEAVAAGGTLTGVVPARVANLTNEVVNGMFLNKLRVTGAMVATLAAVAVGLVAAAGPEARAERQPEGLKTAAADPPAVNRGAAPGKPVVDGDLAAIQGVWDGEHVLVQGAVTPEPVAWGRCVVRGDVAWMLPANGLYATRWEVRLTPGRNPKWIDLVTDGCSAVVSERVPGAVTPGVYRVTAAGWELALPAGRGRLRPAEFLDDGQVMAVRFRRPQPPPVAGQTDARRELEGRWTVTRQAYPHDDRSAMVDRPVGTAEINSGYLFVQRPCSGKEFVWEAIEYALDPTKDPKWIDLTFAVKPGGDAGGYGVYELAGDALRISYRVSVPRSLRTLEFKAGVEEPLAAGGGPARPDDRKPACALLELKRLGPP
jgi:RNA polymerase sigma factor (sigma-70 family)